jgi:excisionase family DNA binding protein
MEEKIGTPFLSRKEAAEYLRISVKTLEKWASTGHRRLPFSKVGSRALYKREHLYAFASQNEKFSSNHGKWIR